MCDTLTWIKHEDQWSPSLVLWHDGEPVTPKVAIYQGDAGYTVSGTGHTQTFKRLHKAMRYGEAYIIDKEAFDNYGTLVRIHIEVSDEPIIEPEDERVTVEFDETERAPEDDAAARR